MLVSLLVCGCGAQLLPSYGEDLVPGYSESLSSYTQADPGLDTYTQDTAPMSGLDMLRMSVPGSPGQASTGDNFL